MDATRLGRSIRALRIREGLRQAALGRAIGVSQDLVSLVERGRLDRVRLSVLDDLAQKLGADLRISLRWRGGDIDRLLDEGHAQLMGQAAGSLEKMGWSTMPEVTFATYADRGSIDVLAWHPPTSTVLVVEIKTEITSVEETLRTHDMKARVAVAVRASAWAGRDALSRDCSSSRSHRPPDDAWLGIRRFWQGHTLVSERAQGSGSGHRRARPGCSCSCHLRRRAVVGAVLSHGAAFVSRMSARPRTPRPSRRQPRRSSRVELDHLRT